MLAIKLTEFQQTILDKVPERTSNGQSSIVEARAGAGKTFILTKLAAELPNNGICIAFNKAIQLELSRRMPLGFQTFTFHALGLRMLRQRVRNVDVNTNKTMQKAKKVIGGDVTPYCQLVSALKIGGHGLPGLPTLEYDDVLATFYYADISLPENVELGAFIRDSIRLFKATIKDHTEADFDDMLYLPLYLAAKYKWQFDQYPYVMVDEAQDVSPLRLAFLRTITSTVIAVGDPFQAIYGFAGALDGALTSIRSEYKAETFELPHSFRCPTNITRAASDLIAPATIKSLAENVGGEIIYSDAQDFLPTAPSQAVLCRMNLPLLSLAMRMLREGLPFEMRSDMPKQLINLVKRFKADSNSQLKVRLRNWIDEMQEQLEKLPSKGPLNAAEEKYYCITHLLEQHESPRSLVKTLETLMLPQERAPVLSTIHKAKGLEWPNVYLLRPDLIPAPWVDKPEDLAQERNLHYVAVTRAIKTFTYLNGDS